MARAYPKRPSITPGDTLLLHVSTKSPRFMVEIYRYGKSLELVSSTDWMDGVELPDGSADQDWEWTGYTIDIGEDWKSGIYIAVIIEGNKEDEETNRPDTSTPDGRDGKALFVVLSQNPGKDACILYKVPVFTYYAYNAISDADTSGSLYTGARKVSFRRPGGGTGGNPWDSYIPDAHDTRTPRQTFAHWDALFVAWLEENEYDVDYCTDLDVHENDQNFLAAYGLLLSVGHDEYWSDPMRQNVQNFIKGGGNVAFFSGNVCWWRVHLEDNNTSMSCDKPADQWFATDPENRLTGVSYRNGSGWWAGARDPVGFRVQYASHWVFDGTGLADGAVFGAEERLVGYECDGCLYNYDGMYNVPTGTDGTPSDFLILGIGDLSTNWQDQLDGNLHATMGIYVEKGVVFTAATTDWARVLESGNGVVDRITRNVLDRLASRMIQIHGPSQTVCGTHNAVEGGNARFRVNPSLAGSNAHYQWSIAPGVGNPKDSPYFDAVMPSPTEPVTVSVLITNDSGCPVFGTLTITPWTKEEAAWAAFWCRFRHLVEHISIVVVGVGEGFGPFVDPLYDPPKGFLRPGMDREQARVLLRDIHLLGKELERLAKGSD